MESVQKGPEHWQGNLSRTETFIFFVSMILVFLALNESKCVLEIMGQITDAELDSEGR